MENRLPIADEGPKVTELLYLRKGEEHFMIAFDPEQSDAVLMELGKMAADKELPEFMWYDAAVLSQRVRRLKELLQEAEPAATGVQASDVRRIMYEILSLEGLFSEGE